MKLFFLKQSIFSIVLFLGTIKCYSQTRIELSSITLEFVMPNDFLSEYKIEINNNVRFNLNSELDVIITKYPPNSKQVTINKKIPLKIYRNIEKELLAIKPKDIFSIPIISDDSGEHIVKVLGYGGEIVYRFSSLEDTYLPKNSTYWNLKKACELLLNFAEIKDLSFNH